MGACTSKTEVLPTSTGKSATRNLSSESFDLGDYKGGAILISTPSNRHGGRAQSLPTLIITSPASGTTFRPSQQSVSNQAGQEPTKGKPNLSVTVPALVHSFSRDDFLQLMQDHDQDDFPDTTPTKISSTSSPHSPPLRSTSSVSSTSSPMMTTLGRRFSEPAFSEPAVSPANNSDMFAYRVHQIRQKLEHQNKHTLSPLGGQKGSRITMKFSKSRRRSVPSVFSFSSKS